MFLLSFRCLILMADFPLSHHRGTIEAKVVLDYCQGCLFEPYADGFLIEIFIFSVLWGETKEDICFFLFNDVDVVVFIEGEWGLAF